MDAAAALDQVVAAFGAAGEDRAGQRAMAQAVETAIATDRHLVVEAGTGTGKSLGYLIPSILSRKSVVVATATKALQDQLVDKDLPFLAEHLGVPFTFTALKGRSNYLCLQRAREVAGGNDEQLALDGVGQPLLRREARRLVTWATEQLAEEGTGDRAALPFEPAPAVWSAVSVSARECPGANRCPSGDVCFCERARDAAAVADVVVVNIHLYGMHLASEGTVLPEHDVVVIDEAHNLEDIISATSGLELGAGRFTAAARNLKAILTDDSLLTEIHEAGEMVTEALSEHVDRRLRRIDGALTDALAVGRSRLERALAALRTIRSDVGDSAARKERAMKSVSALIDDIDAIHFFSDASVAWVEVEAGAPRLRVAPIEVGLVLQRLWESKTVVLTSATLSPTLPVQLGLPAGTYETLDVGSPFDFETNAMLYCALHLPDPRAAGYEAAMHDELAALIEAAGGRTLALFTSYRAMTAAVEEMRSRLAFPLLAQGDLPKPALVAAFAIDEEACLFATMGFWQGIDVPGRSLSLVTVDRLPFPRPDEPLLQARRERARAAAFTLIDLSRATTLLAQGAGRLVRSTTDRGVVAVLDPRLATARYRWQVVNALPPMRRTRDRTEVESFLRAITANSTH